MRRALALFSKQGESSSHGEGATCGKQVYNKAEEIHGKVVFGEVSGCLWSLEFG
ncbi:MAG: hypothetical protein ABIJ23_03620 [Candidatus Magasanikbacteria bacterium]